MEIDNLTVGDVVPGGDLIDNAASGVKNVFVAIRNRAKAKSAQETADAGKYWTLRPFLKSLIPIPDYIISQTSGQGITRTAVLQLPEQAAGTTNQEIIAALKAMSQGGTSNDAAIGVTGSGVDLKKYIPYVIGVVLLGIVIYFVVKKK